VKRGLAHLTIRVKLTLGFLAAMTLVLAATGAFLRREPSMLKRFLTATGALASLGAMALGGSAIASAQNNSTTSAHHAVKVHHTTVETTTGPDTDTVQSGGQTTPDPGKANASGTENGGESGTAADGPGGHADAAGANVDHQFHGQE
jgi:hypothetical protein